MGTTSSRTEMRCKHNMDKKKRLVAWATDCREGHTQGFKRVLSCTGCGEILERKMIPAGVLR